MYFYCSAPTCWWRSLPHGAGRPFSLPFLVFPLNSRWLPPPPPVLRQLPIAAVGAHRSVGGLLACYPSATGRFSFPLVCVALFPLPQIPGFGVRYSYSASRLCAPKHPLYRTSPAEPLHPWHCWPAPCSVSPAQTFRLNSRPARLPKRFSPRSCVQSAPLPAVAPG